MQLFLKSCVLKCEGLARFGTTALSCSCKTHKHVFSKQKYYRWWVSLFPKLPMVFYAPLCCYVAASRLLLLLLFLCCFFFFYFFFYLRLTYLISKKPFEFGRVFDKWKIWRREREGERERRVCVCVCVLGGGGALLCGGK